MKKVRVGVARGGPSNEYEVSLKTGEAVLKNIPERYEAVDIFVDKTGTWHVEGIRHEPHKAVKKVDVIFNAMHGEYGEDGKIQEFLDSLGVSYTGSRAFASRLAMNKALTKSFLEREGIQTPKYLVISKDDYRPDIAIKLFREFPQPAVIKPLSSGSSVGVSISKDFFTLEEALKKAFEVSDQVLIEEYISGKEATCGIVENFKGDSHHVLPLIEIVSKSLAGFFDYDAKYKGQSEEICPGRFSEADEKKIKQLAVKIHKALGLRHYSRSDFIIHPTRGIFFLETNTLPGLTEASLLPKALKTSGSSLSEFLEHVIQGALRD